MPRTTAQELNAWKTPRKHFVFCDRHGKPLFFTFFQHFDCRDLPSFSGHCFLYCGEPNEKDVTFTSLRAGQTFVERRAIRSACDIRKPASFPFSVFMFIPPPAALCPNSSFDTHRSSSTPGRPGPASAQVLLHRAGVGRCGRKSGGRGEDEAVRMSVGLLSPATSPTFYVGFWAGSKRTIRIRPDEHTRYGSFSASRSIGIPMPKKARTLRRCLRRPAVSSETHQPLRTT